MKGKFDDVPTDPLFDAEPLRERKRKPKAIRAMAQGNCPRCTREKLGLVLLGSHLVWRWHTYRTWSGAPMECTASGVAVCVAPEADPPLAGPGHAVQCPHDRSG